MTFIGFGGNSAATSFDTSRVEQSAWFDGSADKLATVLGAPTATNVTIGFWMQRLDFSSTDQTMFSLNNGATNEFTIRFDSTTNLLQATDYNGSTQLNIKTVTKLRDSAWYHVVLSIDTTQGTATDRAKFYVNGEEVTAMTHSTTYSSSYVPKVTSSTTNTNWGVGYTGSTQFFKGSLAQCFLIEGASIQNGDFAITDLGEFITAGTNGSIWAPAADSDIVSLVNTHGGSKSFCLTSAIGDGTDASTNGNNFTATSMSHAANGSDHTPSELKLKWNVLDYKVRGSGIGFGAGARVFSGTGAAANQARSNMPLLGKTYLEMHRASNQLRYFSITAQDDEMANFSINSGRAGLHGIYLNSSSTFGVMDGTSSLFTKSFPGSISTDYLMMAFDADAGKLWLGLSGTWYDSAGTTITTADIEAGNNATITVSADTIWHLCSAVYGETTTPTETNGGQLYTEADQWSSSAPSGFEEMSSARLVTADNQGADYFSATLYTGNGSTQAVTGTGFQPDLTWIKNRDHGAGTHHTVTDVITYPYGLFTNLTNAQADRSSFITSMDTDGFSVAQVSTELEYNGNTNTYVAWLLKANGAGSSNTDGSITSTVSVADAGHFSIGTYTGNATAGATIGHGLGGAPELILYKKRSGTANWIVYNEAAGAGNSDYLMLDTTGAKGAAGAINWANSTVPSSTVATLGSDGNNNASAGTYVFYAFRSVPGVCDIGTYIGNNSTDGPYVNVGFRPRWIMVKNLTAAGDWVMYDTARSDFQNPVTETLIANGTNAEPWSAVTIMDILSTGFKWRTGTYGQVNTVNTYLYMAFADIAGGGTLPPVPGI